jgi:hypothetical protein
MWRMASTRLSLSHVLQHLPQGFDYTDQILSPSEECKLIGAIGGLPFREFEFRGFLAKRRTVSFGWRYDFNVQELQQAEQIPKYLLPLRQRVAEFSGRPPKPVPACTRYRVRTGRGHRLAQGQARIRGCNWRLDGSAMPVPVSSQDWHALGARFDRT